MAWLEWERQGTRKRRGWLVVLGVLALVAGPDLLAAVLALTW